MCVCARRVCVCMTCVYIAVRMGDYMCVYMIECVCVCTTCEHIAVRVRCYVCVYVIECVFVCTTRVYVALCVRYMCVCVYVCRCMCVRMSVCVFVHGMFICSSARGLFGEQVGVRVIA